MNRAIVTDKAPLTCTCGSVPSCLLVTSQQGLRVDGRLAATIADHVPVSNVQPFGNCAALTAQAGGVPMPCTPLTPLRWLSNPDHSHAKSDPILVTDSMLPCEMGGIISVVEPNQIDAVCGE